MTALSLAATRRYTVDELLGLRVSLPIVVCPIESVNNHVDIGKPRSATEFCLANAE